MKKIPSLLFLLFLVACKKENKTIYLGGGCTGDNYYKFSSDAFFKSSIEIVAPLNSYLVYHDSCSHSSPCFNPRNPNQIVYFTFGLITATQRGLFVLDLCKGTRKKLLTVPDQNADWGANGWIIFIAMDRSICKIKPNGDSLTQLIASHSWNKFPKWSPDGSKFFYMQGIDTYTADINGNNSQSIGTFVPLDWKNNSTILIYTGADLAWYNILSSATTTITSTPVIFTLDPPFYDRKNNQLYRNIMISNRPKYLRYNFNNNTLDTIRSLNNSYHFYSGGSYSSLSDKIITAVNRNELADASHTMLNNFRDLVIIDRQFKNPRVVTLK